MTFPLLKAFEREWDLRPPVHWLVSWFVGYDPTKVKREPEAVEQAKPQYWTPEMAKEFMRLTGGKIDGVAQIGMGR